MNKNNTKIGVVSCSGEDCLGGTISRLATRKMLELRADETVTICLPLYLVGGEEERGFANEYPTISVDGCDKYCGKRATEKYSGKVSASINVGDIIGEETAKSAALSCRDLTDVHKAMVKKVSDVIQEKYDEILKK
ncbi:MAG TPA: putative zinc-binding protein [Candidatus Gastranaerophilaceae bacterium]|nr:putative zinc-binding protein [Candidatus Gastranaerophilaceae bacterium]HPT41984.1 putative zinc-binding protein [Candidatus Gastranaerophilaceae bacterium]